MCELSESPTLIDHGSRAWQNFGAGFPSHTVHPVAFRVRGSRASTDASWMRPCRTTHTLLRISTLALLLSTVAQAQAQAGAPAQDAALAGAAAIAKGMANKLAADTTCGAAWQFPCDNDQCEQSTVLYEPVRAPGRAWSQPSLDG
jgi:hypothetical protein